MIRRLLLGELVERCQAEGWDSIGLMRRVDATGFRTFHNDLREYVVDNWWSVDQGVSLSEIVEAVPESLSGFGLHRFREHEAGYGIGWWNGSRI